jgi:transposase
MPVLPCGSCLVHDRGVITGQCVRIGGRRRRYSQSMTQRPTYPSDLSDARWALIEPRLSAWRQARTDAGVGGRVASHDLREIFNAILYVNRTGIAWRYLPHDLPPWQTVYGYFTAWTHDGIFTQLNYDMTGLARTKAGRRAEPSAAVIDTQSVKTSANAPTATPGTDAGKRIIGRKRGIVTDTLGLLLAVIVTAASASDNMIGMDLLDRATTVHPTLAKAWVDAGFKSRVIEHGARLGVDVEIVTKDPQVKGFSVVKRRWVIERTLGWLMQRRRLVRDYEARPDNSASMITIAMIDNLTKRLTDETTPTWRDT